MLRIDRSSKSLERLKRADISDAGLTERDDIQRMIRNCPEAFFSEMGEKLLLIGEETRPAEFVNDRIDLLAIDQQGATVTMELKRGTDKLQLLQALSYASMVADWDGDQLVGERSCLAGESKEQARETIEEFLLEDIGELGETQRVILLAEDYDYEVLKTAKWLTENYDVDIRCYRFSLSSDHGGEFLSCTCIYPPPEIAQHAIQRRKSTTKAPRWADWEDALKGVDEPAVEDFFRQELQSGRENYLPQRRLSYRVKGKRRFNVHARSQEAYVWQRGRFSGDEEFWHDRLGEGGRVQPVKDGACLRFYLQSEEDFERFMNAVVKELTDMEFLSGPPTVGEEEG